ncbi:hypothetical protein SEA_VORRPS_75 [Mycobacterium phage Vorrps]|nr:hypothetical protein SEA_VORRPS_75 [Mycobacterium phage Vorrps]UAW08426.1 hypothetical protein SEA_MORI_75 [Mycobacterium phage Mori]WNO28660.1 hypothetical protein SEA_MADKILLAH_76 [Mycobacterium phage MadKillah]
MSYDLDLRSSGDGWVGTFGVILRRAIGDITDDGPYSPVEVTLDDGQVFTGTLHGFGFDVMRIEDRDIELDRVRRFQA